MENYSTHISHTNILQASEVIAPYIHETPVLTSTILNQQSGKNLYFKCEHLQKTGSFKARGAINALLNRPADCKGVVTHSSGNHGQAVAWASTIFNLKSVVVVPEDTPKSKTSAILGYGAELVYCASSQSAREETCQRIATERGFYIVPSSNHYDVMAGQGTIAVEFLKQVPDLDAILIPVSGGGMASGIAIMAKHIKPSIKLYCVEALGKELEPCLAQKQRLWPNPPQFVKTIAEGIRLQQVSHLTFPILCDLVETGVFSASDADMVQGMQLSFRYMKQVVEAASGAAVHAAVCQGDKLPADITNIGVILCGGNIDINKLPW